MSEMKALPAAQQARLQPSRRTSASGIRRHVVIGLLAVAALVFGLGGLAAMIDFAGAVVGHGTLVVSGNVKKVQHQTGGTVTEILVKDGDKVKAGDAPRPPRPDHGGGQPGHRHQGPLRCAGPEGRLEAERSGATARSCFPRTTSRARPKIPWPPRPSASRPMPSTARRRWRAPARRTSSARRSTSSSSSSSASNAQEDAIRRQIALSKDEVEGLRTLRGQDLVSTAAHHRGRDAARRSSTASSARSSPASRADRRRDRRGRAADHPGRPGRAERGVEAARRDRRRGSTSCFERKIAADDQVKKQTIVAPITGTVYQLAAHTVGGVVDPGEDIMLIVPENDELVVEAQISPAQIDRVHADQEAVLRFTSFGSRETPEYIGAVDTVSPDLITDQRTGMSYYKARIDMPQRGDRRARRRSSCRACRSRCSSSPATGLCSPT